MFRNKLDEDGKVVRNKVKLVANGYSQQKGLDYTETYAHVVKFEAIQIFISFATYSKIKLYQMDIKSVFLNGDIKAEVYMEQPPGFECFTNFKNVFKLNKVLYGLK